MHRLLLTAAFVAVPLFGSTPVLAMSGIDAARSCAAQPKRCSLQMDEGGGATIYVDGYVIDCNSPQEECTIIIRPRLLGGGVSSAGDAGEVLDPARSTGAGKPGPAAPRSGGLVVDR